MRQRLASIVLAISVCQPLALGDETGQLSADQALLRQKLVELDQLQAEIASLRKAMAMPQQILVTVEMLEVSLTGMRKQGFAVPTLEDGVEGGALRQIGSGNETFEAFVAMLKQNNLARTLANPSLTVASGQPATMFVGELFPLPAKVGATAPVEYAEAGQRLEVLAESLGNNRVRLHVKSRQSSAKGDWTVDAVPSIEAQECDTTCEAAFGETVALGGQVQRRVEASRHWSGKITESTNEIELWVVVRAEDATDAAPRETRIRAASHEASVTPR